MKNTTYLVMLAFAVISRSEVSYALSIGILVVVASWRRVHVLSAAWWRGDHAARA